jgi:serine/threonine protein kinase
VDKELIGELLGRWYEGRDAGREPAPEDLCQDRPDLLEELRKAISKARRIGHQFCGGRESVAEEPKAARKPGDSPVEGYTLVAVMGRGGTGEVGSAAGPGQVAVALKFVRLDSGLGQLERKALESYCKVKGHAHLVSLHAWWVREQEKELVLAMELANASLKDLLLQRYPNGVPLEWSLRYVKDAAEGLDFLHSQGAAAGWQHRDVKPANLLLFGDSVKVGDFGLAKELRQPSEAHSGVGTPGYSPPEFGEGRVDKNSDQYSLARTYVELRLGPRASYSEFRHRYPREAAIVDRALAPDPRARWESCIEFVERLREAHRFEGAGRGDWPALGQPASMRVFISYRREDSKQIAGRLSEQLKAHFGHENVFCTDVIPPGLDSREHLDRAVGRCNVLLAVMGVRWLEMPSGDGPKRGVRLKKSGLLNQITRFFTKGPKHSRRLDDPTDFVRIEIEAALAHDIPVVPVLIGKARMPSEQELPEGHLQKLAYRQFVEVRAGRSFRKHVDHLIRAIEGLRPREPRPGELVAIPLAPGVEMKFAWIPSGRFLMGSPPEETGRNGDETQHWVTLTYGFYLGIHPTTQAQWQAVMGNNPSRFRGEDYPVETVSWDDCQAFCRNLEAKTGKRFRLPTEAEWEYACRAGTTTPFYYGEREHLRGASLPTGVGRFPANAWGWPICTATSGSGARTVMPLMRQKVS